MLHISKACFFNVVPLHPNNNARQPPTPLSRNCLSVGGAHREVPALILHPVNCTHNRLHHTRQRRLIRRQRMRPGRSRTLRILKREKLARKERERERAREREYSKLAAELVELLTGDDALHFGQDDVLLPLHMRLHHRAQSL